MMPYLRVANVYEDRIDTSDVMHMHFEPAEAKRFELKHGDILLNEGQSRELVGRPAMYRGELPGACFTNSLVRFQARDCVDNRYALALFLHWLKNGSFQAIAQITTNIAHLGAGRFAEMDFPLPPLNEQRRIVAKLEALQSRSRRAREALDAVPPLLEKLRQSILAAAFRGDLTADWRAQNPNTEPASALLARIRTERRKKWEEAELAKLKAKGKAPTDDRWKEKYKEPQAISAAELPRLPEGWCWASLDELIVDGPTNGFSPKSESTGSGTPTLKLSATSRGVCVLNERTTKKTVEAIDENEPFWLSPGDLLIQRANTLDYVGTTAVFDGPDKTYIYPDLMMRVRANVRTGPYFLWRALTTSIARSHMRSRATGTAGNMPKVNGDVVRSIPIPLPPLGEQAVMLALLERNDGSVAVAEAQSRACLEQLQTLDSSILAKAFRGELVPQDPNDEPADVALLGASAASAEPSRQRARRAKAAE